jgi:hypothetical protein
MLGRAPPGTTQKRYYLIVRQADFRNHFPWDNMADTQQASTSGPCPGCLDQSQRTRLRSYGARAGLWRCRRCGRDFLLAAMYFDDFCVEAMDYELWRAVEPGEGPDTEDLADYIMNHKPYFARNVLAGGEFQQVL